MIVDHSRRLHESIANRRAHKAETSLFQGAAHGIGFHAGGRNVFGRAAFVDFWFAAYKLPDIACETAAGFLHGQKGLSIPDCRFDFQAIANNAGVDQQFANFLFIVARNLFGIEIVKRSAESLAFAKDNLPTQAPWAASSTRNSKSLWSFLRGTPHSRS